MTNKELLKQVQDLLKAAKEDPKAFEELAKTLDIKKDDQPHPANSPEDKAHDVKEEGQSIPEAAKEVKGGHPAIARMLAHLRTLKSPSQLRSPENRAIGKAELQAKPKTTIIRGINRQHSYWKTPGSTVPRTKFPAGTSDKMRQINTQTGKYKMHGPKGDLGKAAQGETKHDRCVEGVKESSPHIKNPHAVCVAAGVKPSSWKKSEKIEKMLKAEWKPRFAKCGYVYKGDKK